MLPTLISAGAVILILGGALVWILIANAGLGGNSTATPAATPTASATPTPTFSATPTPSPTPSPTPPPPLAGPSAEDLENFRAAIATGNTQALVSHFTNPVNVILAASEGIGPSTPDEAALFIAQRVEGTTWWNFEPDPALVDTWRSTPYGPYFPEGGLVGVASEGNVIALSFTGDKISTVFVAYESEL
jgi:hypothetical protein